MSKIDFDTDSDVQVRKGDKRAFAKKDKRILRRALDMVMKGESPDIFNEDDVLNFSVTPVDMTESDPDLEKLSWIMTQSIG